MRWLSTLVTGADNLSLDAGRILFLASIAVFLLLAWHSSAPFAPVEFGKGIAYIFGSAGLMLRLKAGTEPPAPAVVAPPGCDEPAA